MTRQKIINLTLLFFIYSLIVNTLYRPYVYKNKIFDYGLADIGNNVAFIPGVYLVSFLVKKKFIISKYLDIWMCFLLFVTIEILSYYFPLFGTFDWKDILGLFIGSLVIFLIVKYEK